MHMKTSVYFLIIFSCLVQQASSQNLIPQGFGLQAFGYSVKSISVVQDSVIWVNADLVTGWTHPIKVFRSADAGETWETYDVTSCLECKTRYIKAVDENTAWLTAYDRLGFGHLYKTEDGGQTWTRKLTNHAAKGTLTLFDSQHILCQFEAHFSFSNDKGETWESAMKPMGVPGYIPYLHTSPSHAGDTAWFGMTADAVLYPGAGANLIRTTQYGQQISILDSNLDSLHTIWVLSFSNHLDGMMIYSHWQYFYDPYYGVWYYIPGDKKLAVCNDGGETWTSLKSPTLNIQLGFAVPGTVGMYFLVNDAHAASDRKIFWTMDNGASWSTQAIVYPIVAIDFSSADAGWIAVNGTTSQHPLVYKWNAEVISDTENSADDHSTELQVYPNPSLDMIRYAIPENEHVEAVTLTDTGGQVFMMQSTPTAELNINHLPPGIYLLRIQTSAYTRIGKVVKY